VQFVYHTSMHDFPAYDIFCGWCVHGKMACLVCREVLRCIWLKKESKFSFFDIHRQFLPIDHAFRNDSNGFKTGIVVHNEPPP
jgi:hypothetical protein